MKNAKFAALALVAVATLSACSANQAYAEAPLPVTGGAVASAEAYGLRDELITQHLAGASVQDQLAAVCVDLSDAAGLTGTTYAEQWILLCESPDHSWDAASGMWEPNGN